MSGTILPTFKKVYSRFETDGIQKIPCRNAKVEFIPFLSPKGLKFGMN